MYEDTVGCNFDSNSMPQSAETVLDTTPETTTTTTNFAAEENLRLSTMEELSYHHQENQHSAMEIELQSQLGFDMDNPYNNTSSGTADYNNNNNSAHLVSFEQQQNWDFNIHGVHDQMQQQQQQLMAEDGTNNCTNSPYPLTPDLLDLFSLPRCPPSSVPYDQLFHLNMPPQPPFFRELLQSVPHGYAFLGSLNGSLFSSGGDDREGSGGGVYADGINGSGVLEFSPEIGPIRRGRNAKGKKPITTERVRRQQLNDKFTALRSLIPNPSKKDDRASIVGDAIGYINELLETVNELKLRVEKKRCGRERSKRQRTEQDGGSGDDESCNMKPLHDQSYNNGSLRSSWLQRKSKDTEVDIRIIDDEVTIKLVQRKKINLLLFVSRLLDELRLDLHHVAGGHIGNSYSFLFNTKMYEGSSLYAKAIADKLIEVLDRQHAEVPPTSSY